MASSREGFILRSAVVFASVAASLKEEILLPNGWPKRVGGGLSVVSKGGKGVQGEPPGVRREKKFNMRKSKKTPR